MTDDDYKEIKKLQRFFASPRAKTEKNRGLHAKLKKLITKALTDEIRTSNTKRDFSRVRSAERYAHLAAEYRSGID